MVPRNERSYETVNGYEAVTALFDADVYDVAL